MRKIFAFLATVLLTVTVWAQSPEKMSYQAVIRNANNNLITSQQVGMQISIIQGSASGTVVYVETQTPTSNANGLVSFEIGTGTTSDDFSSIDWANGPYFIKTETDPAGGTNYTITGTSQLLSVPYALHAKTAEIVTGGISEIDPVFSSSEAANIEAVDITKLGNLSGVNTGDQDLSTFASKTALGDSMAHLRSEIPNVSGFATTLSVTTFLANKVDKISGKGLSTNDYTTAEQNKLSGISAGAEVNVNADWNATSGDAQILNKPSIVVGTAPGQMQYWNGTAWVTVAAGLNGQILKYINGVPTWSDGNINDLSVGDSYQGGIIVYFLQSSDTGYNPNVRHGLIAAPSDQSTGAEWGCLGTDITGAAGTAIGTGNQNTTDIVNGCSTINIAAKLCSNLVLGGYSDWYLPSKDELNKLYLNKNAVGGFANAYYWSSSESNASNVWGQAFGNGAQATNNKTLTNRVRAVRAF